MALQPDITPQEAQRKLSEFAHKAGREVRVFVRDAAVRRGEAELEGDREEERGREGGSGESQGNEPRQQPDESGDKFYEFTAADYGRLLAAKKEERYLKLKKHRDQDLQERRSRIHKAVIRVLFPDGLIIEATFLPTDTVADVRSLIQKCLLNPETPFFFFTAPPKRRIKDEAQDLYSAQLAPGALVHFALEESAPDANGAGPSQLVLSDEILGLRDLHVVAFTEAGTQVAMEEEKEEEKPESAPKPKVVEPTKKTKPGVPKWFKR